MRGYLLLGALAVLCAAGWTNGAPVQWRTEDGGNGHWYEVIRADGAISWTDAKTAAEARGGYLATPTESSENSFVTNMLPLGEANWAIGGYQDTSAPDYSEPSGGWGWITGEEWDFTSWCSGEPNNGVGWGTTPEDALVMPGWSPWRGQWNDAMATGVMLNGYVVEYSTIPEPFTLSLLALGGLAVMRKRRTL